MAASMFTLPMKVLSRSRVHTKCVLRSTVTSVRCLSTQQLYITKFGDPNGVLQKKSVELPSSLGPKEVLVKMKLSPINPSDVNMIEGTYFVQPNLPAVMGNEGVGEILELGSEVRGLEKGNFVIPADTAWGTWETHKIADEKDVIKIPNDIPVLSAATISVNPCTAYRMLKDYVDLSPGDIVIQNGANSGVGVSVIQLAKEWKIKTINIVRDRPDFDKLRDYLTTLGADMVVTEDFVRTSEMKDLLKSLPARPKLAFNCVGGKSATELLRHLDQAGVMVTYGGMSKHPIMVPTGALIFKEIKMCGYWNTNWNHTHKTDLARFTMLSDLCSLIKEKKFVPPTCEFFTLDDYKSAMEKATEGFKRGKVVFKFD